MNQSTEKLKKYFSTILREKFNSELFDQDVKNHKSISPSDVHKYIKEEVLPEEEDEFEGDELLFKARFRNGMYTAIGSNGHIIKASNLDDLNRQLAKVFKLNALRKHKAPQCFYRIGDTSISLKEREKKTQSFVKNFIKEGVAVGGDLPQSKEFWANLKCDYLSKEGATIESWNSLTRYVPRDLLLDTYQQQPLAISQIAYQR